MNRHLQLIFRNVVTSIAFLPAIISLLFFLFSVAVIYLELSFPGKDTQLSENMQVLLVKGNDNARQVLGTLIGGVISLTVFSFSMVMVLLNQATSNFTPRIIPGLLTDKRNQFVLGFYIGTIIYCLIIILNVRPGERHQDTPKFGVLLAMLFGIACLFLFIYFIHLISRKLQIDVIIASAARHSVAVIRKGKRERSMPVPVPDTTGWYALPSREAGYLSGVNEGRLDRICRQHRLQIQMLHAPGVFLTETDAVCKLSYDPDKDRRLRNKVLSCLHFSNEPYGEGSHLYGMNQISEVAVKALSPGINDPGSAAIALDYLGHVFCVLLGEAPEGSTRKTPQEPAGLISKKHSLAELLFLFIQPIAYYGRQDAKVHAKLLGFYGRLPAHAPAERELIQKLMAEEKASISRHIESPSQVDLLQNCFRIAP
jgi:uncharacterized membrane protein